MALGDKYAIALAVENAFAENLSILTRDGQLQDSGKQIKDLAPAALDKHLILYVNADAGNDSNDGLSELTAKRTIQAAVNTIPKNLGEKLVEIRLADGVYTESIAFSGFHGGGNSNNAGIALIGSGESTTIVGNVFAHCSVSIMLSTLSLNGNLSGYFSSCLYLDRVTVTATSDSAIFTEFTPLICYKVAVHSTVGGGIVCGGATAFIHILTGSVSGVGITAGNPGRGISGLIVVSNNTMAAGTRYQKSSGGAIIENGVLV